MTAPAADTVEKPPPPAEITFNGHWGKNPLGGVSFWALCARLPSVLGRTGRMA